MISEDDVRAAVRSILLREAPEESISGDAKHHDLQEFQQVLLSSVEYQLAKARWTRGKFRKWHVEETDVRSAILSLAKQSSPPRPPPPDQDRLSRMLQRIAAVRRPLCLVVVGEAQDEDLALSAVRAIDGLPSVVLSNAPVGKLRDVEGSPPVLSLQVGAEALLSFVLDRNIVPDWYFVGRGESQAIYDTILSRMHGRALIVIDHAAPLAEFAPSFDAHAAALMCEIVPLDGYSLVCGQIFDVDPTYAPVEPQPIKRGCETIALATMVKNEADMIEPMLRSCAGVVDYVVIADTGSTDDTVLIARRTLESMEVPHRIETIQFLDFSQARNAVIDLVPNSIEWCLMLDADEYLSPNDRHRLLDLARTPGANAWALPRYNHTRLDLGRDFYYYPDRQARFFRVAGPSKFRFVNPVHEHLTGYDRLWAAPADLSAMGGDTGGPHIHHLGCFKSAEKAALRSAQNKALGEQIPEWE